MRGRWRHPPDVLDADAAMQAQQMLAYTAPAVPSGLTPVTNLDRCWLPLDELLARLRDAHLELLEWERVAAVNDTLLAFMVADNDAERERMLAEIAGYRDEVARRLRRARRSTPGLGR